MCGRSCSLGVSPPSPSLLCQRDMRSYNGRPGQTTPKQRDRQKIRKFNLVKLVFKKKIKKIDFSELSQQFNIYKYFGETSISFFASFTFCLQCNDVFFSNVFTHPHAHVVVYADTLLRRYILDLRERCNKVLLISSIYLQVSLHVDCNVM